MLTSGYPCRSQSMQVQPYPKVLIAGAKVLNRLPASLQEATVEPRGGIQRRRLAGSCSRLAAQGRVFVGTVPHEASVALPRESFLSDRAHAAWAPIEMSRGWLMRRLLLAVDVVGLTTAFLFALAIAPSATSTTVPDRVEAWWEVALFIVSLPFWVVLARLHSLYDRDEERSDHSTVDDIFGVFQMVTIGTWSFFAVTHLAGLPHPTVRRLIVFWLAAVLLVPLLRAAVRVVGRRHSAYVQNVIIVGSDHVARLLASKMRQHPEYRLRVLGFVDRDGEASLNGAGRLQLIGATDDLPELVRAHGAHRVVVAFSGDSHEQTLEVIRGLQDSHVQIDIVPRMFEVLGTNAQLHTIEGIPLVGLPVPRLSHSSKFLKRSLDLVGAIAGLILLAPLFAITAAWIKLDSRGPVFFRQVRMGAADRAFRVFKFRTMVNDAEVRKGEVAHLNMHEDDDPRMFKVPNDPRITRVGAFLRRSRIDELPQLFNVIRGEMSLVGPRPLILDEDQYVERWARRRLELKPGMTGLWQVLGASDIPFDEMTKLDYLYVTNWSLREDLRLIMLTLPALVRPRAAY
jgi:exopolysaccharide biosynthesis polyprenyl glycosylphosphotransferase